MRWSLNANVMMIVHSLVLWSLNANVMMIVHSFSVVEFNCKCNIADCWSEREVVSYELVSK